MTEPNERARHTALVRITHWTHALSFFALLISGIAILVAHPRFYWGETGGIGATALFDLPLRLRLGHSGWGRYLHFLAAWIAVAMGAVYIAAGAARGHFRFRDYGAAQRTAYRAIVFGLFPLIAISGLAMSPAIVAAAPWIARAFGGQQSARTIHFLAASAAVMFVIAHVAMVIAAGFAKTMRAMLEPRGLITRRGAIATGLTAAGGAALLAGRRDLIPPDHGGVFGAGETMTYAAQRLLLARHPLAREFERSQISKVAPVNGEPPGHETYQRLLAGGFAEWRLRVEGLVERPSAFSLAQLKQMPARTQITHQACEEGWSFIAEWRGVPVAHVLRAAGASARAKYVVFLPFDEAWDSLDMADAWHPQTILAYGMNGADLPNEHGAPLRLRVARQLGYKSVKYLARVVVTDSLKEFGAGLGSISPEEGYSWYAGI